MKVILGHIWLLMLLPSSRTLSYGGSEGNNVLPISFLYNIVKLAATTAKKMEHVE